MKVILLSKGFVCVVSKEDFKKVNKYKWYTHFSKGTKRACGQPYARTNIDGKKIYMHRLILNIEEKNIHVDHINHCTLDNRRENLQKLTCAENLKRRRKK